MKAIEILNEMYQTKLKDIIYDENGNKVLSEHMIIKRDEIVGEIIYTEADKKFTINIQDAERLGFLEYIKAFVVSVNEIIHEENTKMRFDSDNVISYLLDISDAKKAMKDKDYAIIMFSEEDGPVKKFRVDTKKDESLVELLHFVLQNLFKPEYKTSGILYGYSPDTKKFEQYVLAN